MKLYKEIDSIEDYEAWSGAVYTIKRLEELDAQLDELFPEGCSETELNDFLWFECDTIAEMIGHSGDLFDDDDDETEAQ